MLCTEQWHIKINLESIDMTHSNDEGYERKNILTLGMLRFIYII